MAPHSSTLAWKIPWTEEPGRLQSMGSQRVGHDWATPLSLFTFLHWRRKWQPTPVSLPGESQGQGSLLGSHLCGRTQSRTRLKRLGSGRMFSCSMQTLSCSMWNLVPWPESEPGPLSLGAWSLSHRATRKVPKLFFSFIQLLIPCCSLPPNSFLDSPSLLFPHPQIILCFCYIAVYLFMSWLPRLKTLHSIPCGIFRYFSC